MSCGRLFSCRSCVRGADVAVRGECDGVRASPYGTLPLRPCVACGAPDPGPEHFFTQVKSYFSPRLVGYVRFSRTVCWSLAPCAPGRGTLHVAVRPVRRHALTRPLCRSIDMLGAVPW